MNNYNLSAVLGHTNLYSTLLYPTINVLMVFKFFDAAMLKWIIKRTVSTSFFETPFTKSKDCSQSCIRISMQAFLLCVLKPISCKYNFVEVSGHNLESSHSQTWGFCMDFLNHREGQMLFYQVFLLSPLQCTVAWISSRIRPLYIS